MVRSSIIYNRCAIVDMSNTNSLQISNVSFKDIRCRQNEVSGRDGDVVWVTKLSSDITHSM